MDLSVVIPIYNESENIEHLIEETYQALIGIDYEIVVVDDSSTDNTLDLLKRLKKTYRELRVILHEKNYGQSSAIQTGARFANANIIATMDGDGQNDPADIPALFEQYIKLEKKHGEVVIAGFRVKRCDTFLKRISSRYANKLRSYILKDNVPDSGFVLKIFNRQSFLALPFFDHYHRYLPALFINNGAKIFSFKVNHRLRTKGYSKYGFHNRFWVGITDLLGVRWLQKRSKNITAKEK